MNTRIRSSKWLVGAILPAILVVWWWTGTHAVSKKKNESFSSENAVALELPPWSPPDSALLAHTLNGDMIRYGKKLIAYTAWYLGPGGHIRSISNGMNCQNCHLDAGAKLYGNNYSAVFSTYPKLRDRSGTVENIYKRINDCFERSLNGHPLDTNSREMQAMSAYINWLGQNVPKGNKPKGSGITDIKFLDHAADSAKGHAAYMLLCQRCHGSTGEGLRKLDSPGYTYPPLWGDSSYTTAAGLYRITRLAGFIRDNMPYGSSHNAPQITDEEAWNLAAFVNSQPRPVKIFGSDWPNKAKKPVDFPFGPYADSFSEKQHKYGPFGPMLHASPLKGSPH